LGVVVSLVLVAGVFSAPAWCGDLKIPPADEYNPEIVATDFQDAGGNPLPINNKYWPLEPGTTFVYEDEDGEEHNTVEVTDETKEITLPSGDKIVCVVVRDLEWEDDGEEDGIWTEDELVERTDDWFAQDVHGNVWYFGEYSESREDAESRWETEGSWEAYQDGALPGILMLADPQNGDAYRQEFYEDEAEDMAKVLKLNAKAEVPAGDYSSCLKTKEWNPLESGNEHKYYAPGVGLVLVEELKGGIKRVELLEIIK
jgi:hypothetical protein